MQILQDARRKGIFPAVMDVTDETSVCDTIAAAFAARRPIQICVANAGIAKGRALYKTDLALWKRIMATNLDGTFLTIRECFKSMRGTDWGARSKRSRGVFCPKTWCDWFDQVL